MVDRLPVPIIVAYWRRVALGGWRWTLGHPFIAWGAILMPPLATLALQVLAALWRRQPLADIDFTISVWGIAAGVVLWAVMLVAGLLRSAPAQAAELKAECAAEIGAIRAELTDARAAADRAEDELRKVRDREGLYLGLVDLKRRAEENARFVTGWCEGGQVATAVSVAMPAMIAGHLREFERLIAESPWKSVSIPNTHQLSGHLNVQHAAFINETLVPRIDTVLERLK